MDKRQKIGLIVFSFIHGVFLTVVVLFALFELKVLPCIQEKNAQIKLLSEKILESRKYNYNYKDNRL